MGLTRRDFLKGSLLGSFKYALTGLIYLTLDRRSITFEQARSNPGLRQAYLKEIANYYFEGAVSRYTTDVIYDHEFKTYRKICENELSKWVDDERTNARFSRFKLDSDIEDALIHHYSGDARFGPLNPRRKEDLREYLATSYGHKDHKQRIKEKAMEAIAASSETFAMTVNYQLDFGTGIKSRILFFPSLFDKNESIYGPVTESRIIGAFGHELSHAMHASDGLFVAPNLRIDSSNFPKIHPAVFEFIEHSSAKLDGINAQRRLGFARRKDGKFYSCYKNYLLEFSIDYRGVGEDLQGLEGLIETEKRLLSSHTKKVSAALKEAEQILGK